MKLKIMNVTLIMMIISFSMLSFVYAQKAQLDFQSPSRDSMSCEDSPSGIFCIESKPVFSEKTKNLVPTIEDSGSLKNFQGTNSVLSKNAISAAAGWEMKCLSDGDSVAVTGKAGGFCLASDMSSSAADLVSFSVANGLPATGLQFLQITLRDGSILVGSREIPDADDSMSTTCVSAGGSTSTTASDAENDRGFCLAADFATAIPAAFAVANSLPMAGVHFLQVMFNVNQQPGALPSVDGDASIGAKCVSVDGSTAATGNIGGFCLVSDLNISTTGDANFSVANALSVTSMHYLQVTFGDGNVLDPLRSYAYPQLGAECTAVAGSSANTGSNGVSCLASDLYSSTTGTASISFANHLPIVGMQFLQATFADSGQLNERAGAGAKCVSDGGSMAIAGNAEGFCLVSDRSTPTTDFANLAFANDLPVASLYFLQIPFNDRRQQDGPGNLLSEGAPVGVIISDFVKTPLYHTFLPDLAGITDYQNHYFRISQRRSGIAISLSPGQRLRPVFITSH
jgi:hypothetical protein